MTLSRRDAETLVEIIESNPKDAVTIIMFLAVATLVHEQRLNPDAGIILPSQEKIDSLDREMAELRRRLAHFYEN